MAYLEPSKKRARIDLKTPWDQYYRYSRTRKKRRK